MPQTIHLLPEKMKLVRYARGDGFELEFDGSFFAFIRTADECSLVMEQAKVPRKAPKKSTGWRLFQVQGPFPLDVIGVLASITSPLASAKVSVFALATFDTDYFLVQGRQLKKAIQALRSAGHTVTGAEQQFDGFPRTSRFAAP